MDEIRYTSHLKVRLEFRELPHELPREIYQEADERYFDTHTLRKIAVKRVPYRGRVREFLVAYDERGPKVLLVTIHPLKPHQKYRRVLSGRWKPL